MLQMLKSVLTIRLAQSMENKDIVGEIMGDVKNFSDKEPQLMPGTVVGTS